MKKNRGLIIGLLIFLVIAGIAVWYFFFKGNGLLKIGEDVNICPAGTTGTYPDCISREVTQNTIFNNGIDAAKQRINSRSNLTEVQKVNAINIINREVTKDKLPILVEVEAGKDIVELILINTERKYLAKYSEPIILSTAGMASAGKG